MACGFRFLGQPRILGIIRCGPRGAWTYQKGRNYSVEKVCDYVQGQSPERRIREYFYYVDHQGQLFLDDTKVKNFITCFKDKVFLEFFFRRVKKNNCGRYEEFFPYLSLCGRERNFIRCDDYPIVFTHFIEAGQQDLISYGGAGEKLSIKFEPETLCMLPHTGRVYHAAPDRFGGIGLIKSSLAIDISPGFKFDDESRTVLSADGETVKLPSKFLWKGHTYELTNDLCDKVLMES